MNEREISVIANMIEGLKPWMEERIQEEVRGQVHQYIMREMRGAAETALQAEITAALGDVLKGIEIKVTANLGRK